MLLCSYTYAFSVSISIATDSNEKISGASGERHGAGAHVLPLPHAADGAQTVVSCDVRHRSASCDHIHVLTRPGKHSCQKGHARTVCEMF